MAESQAMIGYGTKFQIASNNSPAESPQTYIDMAEITNVAPPNAQVDDVDVTHNESPDRTREFIAGLIDPGEASFEMNFIPGSASDIILFNLKQSGEKKRMRIVFPNAAYWDFLGYVKGYEPSSQTEDKMAATVTLRTAGAVTKSY